MDKCGQFGYHVRQSGYPRLVVPRVAYVCWSTVSGYPFGLITQCVVCPLFAGIDVHVLVAARFRTAGT